MVKSIYDVKTAFTPETQEGTTPAAPAFEYMAFDTADLSTDAAISEQRALFGNGRVTGTVAGIRTVTGTLSGALHYGVMDGFIASALQGVWNGDILSDGLTTSTFTIEKSLEINGTTNYFRHVGISADSMDLSLETNSPVSVSFGVTGHDFEAVSTTEIAGATYADPSNTRPLSSQIDVGTITLGSFGEACISSLSINVSKEGGGIQNKIGVNQTCGIAAGGISVTGTITVVANSQLAAFVNTSRSTDSSENTIAIAVNVGSVSGEKYTITIPKARITNSPMVMDTTPSVELTFTAIHDGATDAAIKITRGIA